MDQLEKTNFVDIGNRIVLGTILLLIIIVAGFYLGVTYLDIYKDLSSTTELSNAEMSPPDINEQEAILNSISKLSIVEIGEKDKLSALASLVSRENIKIKDRENILNSLK
jgi:hypothetical protein